MSTILVIDTSTEACSVALSVAGSVYERFEVAPRQHGELILPMVDSVLQEAQVTLEQLDVIGFGRGPGAFTGLRICVSIAQGLAYGANKPLVGVSSLQAMAQQAHEESQAQQVATAIDARMGEVYWALYQVFNGLMKEVEQAQESVSKPELLRMNADINADSIVAVGTGWKPYSETLSPLVGQRALSVAVELPRARYMIPWVEHEFNAGRAVSAEYAEPVYLRNDVAKKKAEQKKKP